jgi:hypothetical protein
LLCVALLALLELSGCGGGATDNSAATSPNTALAAVRPVVQSDLEIAQLLYADNQRTPQGFYTETLPPVQGYTATVHLKNTDLTGATSGAQFELCTDDWNTALSWSDQVAATEQLSALTETNTTTQYFEFGRTRSGTPQGFIRSRVYRCSYLDRSAVDLRGTGTAAGVLNLRPITASDVQHLAEYLWQFTAYNNYGNVVLKSSGATVNTGLAHTLVMASITAAQASGGCDHIFVIGWTHTVDTQSGVITRTAAALWDFGAQQSAGMITMCNPN